MTAPLMRCGNLADHEPHDWRGQRRNDRDPDSRTYHCRGHVLTETALAEYARVADKRDNEQVDFTAWVAGGIGADPFAPDDPETADDVLAPREDIEQVRRFPVGWWGREPGGAA